MPLNRGQRAKITLASAGVISVFGLFAHLSYSKAKGGDELRRGIQEFGYGLNEQAVAIEDRASEFRRVLALTDQQHAHVVSLLTEYEYGDHSNRWWADRDEFYAALLEELTPEQERQLETWREERYGRSVPWSRRRLRTTGAPETPVSADSPGRRASDSLGE